MHTVNYFVWLTPIHSFVSIHLGTSPQNDVIQIKALREVALVGARVVLSHPFSIPKECLEIADLIPERLSSYLLPPTI